MTRGGVRRRALGVNGLVMAPARTPQSVITRLNSEVARIMAKPVGREKLSGEGVEGAKGTPAAHRLHTRRIFRDAEKRD